MASLVRPIKTLSEMANAFFSRAEWPLCSLSKVPPVQAKRFFFNSLNRLFFREKSGPAGISVALPLSFAKRSQDFRPAAPLEALLLPRKKGAEAPRQRKTLFFVMRASPRGRGLERRNRWFLLLSDPDLKLRKLAFCPGYTTGPLSIFA